MIQLRIRKYILHVEIRRRISWEFSKNSKKLFLKRKKLWFNCLLHVPYCEQLTFFRARLHKSHALEAAGTSDPLHMTSHWVWRGQMYNVFIDFAEMLTRNFWKTVTSLVVFVSYILAFNVCISLVAGKISRRLQRSWRQCYGSKVITLPRTVQLCQTCILAMP